MEISAVREVPSDDGILEVLWPTRDAVRNVPSDDGKLEVLWQTRDAVREVPSDDGILEFLWQNRDELDTEITLTLIKVRQRISKAIRDYMRIQIKHMSRAQVKVYILFCILYHIVNNISKSESGGLNYAIQVYYTTRVHTILPYPIRVSFPSSIN